MNSSLPSLLLALLPLPSVAAQGQVLVVDSGAGPGTDFTAIQPAVDAAGNGDTLLVRAGTYAAFQVSAKSLVITADAGAGVLVNSMGQTTRVADLGTAQRVVLRGISFVGPFADATFLELEDNSGRVWVEDATLGSSFFAFTSTGAPVVRVLDSTDASFLNCAINGASGELVLSPGADGLEIVASDVQLYDCAVTAGKSGFGVGSSGVQLTSGELVVSGCTLLGGEGADGGLCSSGAPGGPGLRIDAGTFWRLDTAIMGGRQGPPIDSACGGPGPHAPPIQQNGGTINDLVGAARHLAVDSPVRESTFANFTLQGSVGDFGFLLISLAQDPHLRLLFTGIQFVADPFFLFPVGPLAGFPATGQLALPVPNLAAPIEGWIVYAQAAFLNGSGLGTAVMLGSASAVTLLDPAF